MTNPPEFTLGQNPQTQPYSPTPAPEPFPPSLGSYGGLSSNTNVAIAYARFAQDYREQIDRFRYTLQGKEIRTDPLNPSKRVVVQVSFEADGKTPHHLLNERGIARLCGVLETYLSPNTFLSNISSERVHERVVTACHAIADELYMNWDTWDCDLASMDSILTQLEIVIEFAFRRAAGAGEWAKIAGAPGALYSQQPNQEREDSGFWSFVPFIGKKSR